MINRSKRSLPHWHREGSTAIYWITFRLADSLPQTELDALKKEKAHFMTQHPKPWSNEVRQSYKERFPARIEAWLDAGHGSCLLANPELRGHLVEALMKFEGERHDLISAMIMPNHVHLLLRLRTGNSYLRGSRELPPSGSTKRPAGPGKRYGWMSLMTIS